MVRTMFRLLLVPWSTLVYWLSNKCKPDALTAELTAHGFRFYRLAEQSPRTNLKLCGFCVVLCGFVVPANSQSHTIPFTLRDGQPLLTITIDGKPMRMLLDTGSNVTIVRKLIGAAGTSLKLRSANGSSLAHNCEIPVEGMRLNGLCGVSYLPDFEDGILGTDFLRHFRSVLLDFAKSEIDLED